MLYLKRRNLRGVSVQELLNAMSTGNTRGLVGITFDDAYENFLQNALPVLERLRFSCTVFVPAGMLGGENSWDLKPRMKLLGVDGVREVSERGMEIGSHGIMHIRLPGLKPELVEQEASGSHQILSEILGEEVEGFCYPYANLDGRAVQAVQRAGYRYACAMMEGVWWRSVYAIPRIFMGETDGAFRLRMKFWAYRVYLRIAQMQGAKTAYILIRHTPIWKYFLRFWYR